MFIEEFQMLVSTRVVDFKACKHWKEGALTYLRVELYNEELDDTWIWIGVILENFLDHMDGYADLVIDNINQMYLEDLDAIASGLSSEEYAYRERFPKTTSGENKREDYRGSTDYQSRAEEVWDEPDSEGDFRDAPPQPRVEYSPYDEPDWDYFRR